MKAVLLVTVLAAACGRGVTTPSFPAAVRLELVNRTTDAVFLRMNGDESAYPGIARLSPSDSQCTDLYAWADSVPVEVCSWTNSDTILGTGWVYPLRHAAWRATVTASDAASTFAENLGDDAVRTTNATMACSI